MNLQIVKNITCEVNFRLRLLLLHQRRGGRFEKFLFLWKATKGIGKTYWKSWFQNRFRVFFPMPSGYALCRLPTNFSVSEFGSFFLKVGVCVCVCVCVPPCVVKNLCCASRFRTCGRGAVGSRSRGPTRGNVHGAMRQMLALGHSPRLRDEGVSGSEIAALNRRSLATFHRTLKSQCSVALSCLANRYVAVCEVRGGHRNRKSLRWYVCQSEFCTKDFCWSYGFSHEKCLDGGNSALVIVF